MPDVEGPDFVTVLVTSTTLQVWNLDSTSQSAVFSPYNAYGDSVDSHLSHTPAFPATEEYKAKAKDIIMKMRAGGGKSYARMSVKMYTSLSDKNQDVRTSPGSSVQFKSSTYKTGTLNTRIILHIKLEKVWAYTSKFTEYSNCRWSLL
jgi:hypothetical protein